MAKPATKAPGGLTIARNNLTFTFSWKISEKDGYVRQHFHWKTNLTDWTAVEIGNTVTTKSVTLTAADYYPTTAKKLTTVSFRVRAIKASGYEWTGWVQKDFSVAVPNVPSLTAALSSSLANVTTFTWDATVKTDDARPFTNVEWQTRLIKENNETDGSKIAWTSACIGWATGTGNRNSSNTRTEDTTLLAANAYTRWFRVRSRGPAGASAWRYAKHVYAKPYEPKIGTSSYTVLSGGSSMTVSINWTAAQNAAHPIDSTMVQWMIETPAAGQQCPSVESWTDALVSRDTGGTDAAKFTISSVPGTDECLFVRIAVQHDSNITYSVPRLVKRGVLSAPGTISTSTDSTTFRATITAANTSDVPDSRLAVIYRTDSKNDKDFVIGIIEHGQSSVTVQCPDFTGKQVSFGVYAFVGSATSSARADGVSQYAVTAKMKSETVWRGGTVPVAPAAVTVTAADDAVGEVIVEWQWSWSEATRAEISWSDSPNAWESTNEPSAYEIPNTHAAKWRVSGLETGQRWYFCVRLMSEEDGEVSYGPYSDPVEIDLSSAPSIPVLSLSAPVITKDGSVTASWVYITTDGTAQAYAEICEATVSGSTVTYGSVIAHTLTQQHVAISGENWTVGETYYLCVRATSESGHASDWSDPVAIIVAEPLTAVLSQSSLTNATIGSRTVLSLRALPLTVTITGAGEGGTTTLVIERAEDYQMDRPDGSVTDGHAGETIAIIRQTGESQISVDLGDLIGLFDDGARYRLIGTVEDGLGQSDSIETEFEVHWTHQAGIPTAAAVIDGTAAKITATAPAAYASGDFCDIYRLSADKPELIVYGGSFGETYVDPYPAIGPHGGHRIVHRTSNGDYITADSKPAWVDLDGTDGDVLDVDYAIVDFAGEQLEVRYNTAFENAFEKDFLETKYLGGAVQGDWNPGISRKTTINAYAESEDLITIAKLRRLAAYTGICHVRTQDGSSYAADVQMNDSMTYEMAGKVVAYTLTITRVDPEGLDGMTLEEWEDLNELE